ncbi:MAG: hypothetical protein MUE81_10445 [Thermoflexibacter sp.]|jgi:hypothetical protein|nr:hypothetical protein [Thermoflexibacter sp.]
MENSLSSDFQLIEKFNHTAVYVWKDKQVLLIVAISNYIPIEEFKKVFTQTIEIISKYHITKVIFDKRKLTVFHQPSMEWYFTTWKEEIFLRYGVKTHRKILPEDNVFVQSVKLGRMKIEKDFPNGKYKELDIQYADSVEEAVAK